ncbi:TetR/AcrR family transcriptional regulator [Gymnodinialimonas ceratoperidinii]|uniref:TetR/AcrR family transcriptional regulator n=2 Tax=Gymnodinialimonas ceratoperidinii TaxID=2856823 RepID=A0A8F6TZC7_9RHOB|nr:TetR/AcrR family transcriptional regulator [Gymnodinialimonas ceratoperidinii]QXT41420.1 TetR/AcrR family transcriptional regulator [Gymnodinialimonas ceratoperidinii]
MTEQSKDTRSHILAVGRSLTARQGFTGVGLNELLKAACVPKGSFYHYFASKEAYGCALLEDFVAQYRESLGSTLSRQDQPARTRLLAYFEEWLARQTSPDVQQRCLVVKLSAEIADLSPDMSRILQNGVTGIIASLTKTLEDGAADGSIAPMQDADQLAQSIYHQWLGASLIAGLSHDDAPLRSAMEATRQAISPPDL